MNADESLPNREDFARAEADYYKVRKILLDAGLMTVPSPGRLDITADGKKVLTMLAMMDPTTAYEAVAHSVRESLHSMIVGVAIFADDEEAN